MASSTRRHQPPPLIYQDPIGPYDSAEMPAAVASSPPDMMGPSLQQQHQQHLRPAQKREIVFNPPATGPGGPSPLKANRQSHSPPKAVFSNRFNVVSIPPPMGGSFNTDSPRKKKPLNPGPATSTPQKALFTTFQTMKPPMGKENDRPVSRVGPKDPSSDSSLYGQPSVPAKRALMESAPIQDRPSKRPRQDGALPVQVPEPEQMPVLEDDGCKPPFSYAMLIGMSILRAPNRRLTLAQIYKWISDTFVYYRTSETGWQNSIRHNLSLNKAFVKHERPKDDPGKGNYWAIEPGMEAQFMKEKGSRRPMAAGPPSSSSIMPAPVYPIPSAEMSLSDEAPTRMESEVNKAGVNPIETLELSSDATLPASDPALQGDDAEEPFHVARTSSRLGRYSSPPQMNSSPPVARPPPMMREGTPPAMLRFPSSGQNRSRQRKSALMNDSGYFSSLESSALRPQAAGPGSRLNSEADLDRPRIKRGRAEEEIARIRHSSSNESPSRARSYLKPPTQQQQQLVSSSPSRAVGDSSLMLPPLTPATTFKMPRKPPQSISPNTNLRNHRDRIRELVGSPLRETPFMQDVPWSPAFQLENEAFGCVDDGLGSVHSHSSGGGGGGSGGRTSHHQHSHSVPSAAFDIFADDADDFLLAGRAFGSPQTRPRLDHRPLTTSGNVLADITGGASNSTHLGLSKASTPLLKVPGTKAGVAGVAGAWNGAGSGRSPSKSPTLNANALFDFSGDIFTGDFFSDEPADFSGVDIMQGFQKIGGGASVGGNGQKIGVGNENVEPHYSTARPLFGRSNTSRF